MKTRVLIFDCLQPVNSWIILVLLQQHYEVIGVCTEQNLELANSIYKKRQEEFGNQFQLVGLDYNHPERLDKILAHVQIVILHPESLPALIPKKNVPNFIDHKIEEFRILLNKIAEFKNIDQVYLLSDIYTLTNLDSPDKTAITLDNTEVLDVLKPRKNEYLYYQSETHKVFNSIRKNQIHWYSLVIGYPYFLGPYLDIRLPMSTTNWLQELGKGKYQNGAPDFEVPVMDVRDFSHTLLRLINLKLSGVDSIYLFQRPLSLIEMGQQISYSFGPKYKFPEGHMSKLKFIWWNRKQKQKRNFFSTIKGRKFEAPWMDLDYALLPQYRKIELSLQDAFRQLINEYIVPKK